LSTNAIRDFWRILNAMSKPSRRCDVCKTEASDPTQTLCTKCQASLPLHWPDRGKCLCCGYALGDPVWIGGSGAFGTGTAFVGNQTVTMNVGGGHHDFSCTHCGDPEPKAYSKRTSLGGVLVGIQVLVFGIVLGVWLSQTQGPWHLVASRQRWWVLAVCSFWASGPV
jgi:hypothetical protein